MSGNTINRRGKARRMRKLSKRGVVSVLAMMFMVLFSTLGIAMAISAKGNLRTASTHLHVQKALAAAETGLEVGAQRLQDAASRFIISPGRISRDLGLALWDGSVSSSLYQRPLPPSRFGISEPAEPAGIMAALIYLHDADQNVARGINTVTDPTVRSRPSGAPEEFRISNWLLTPPIAIEAPADQAGAAPSAYQIEYAPMDDGVTIRVYSTGYSSVSSEGSGYMYTVDSEGRGQAVRRTIYQDFRISKRNRQALGGPSRLMIGKNVNVTGDIGAEYGGDDNNPARTDKELRFKNGDPLIIRSDFFGIDATLDRKLRDFYAGVRAFDADGDMRLRPTHSRERQGFPSPIPEYEPGQAARNNQSFDDATRDGFVDDYDIFLNHFDRNSDGKVALWDAVREDTANETLATEFDLDRDLALLIDRLSPDRNRNGILGFEDTNFNGVWDSGESLLDQGDQALGWADGVLDFRDRYAKVNGRLLFRASSTNITSGRTFRSGQGEVLTDALQGPIVASSRGGSQRYGASDRDLPPLNENSFTAAAATMAAKGEPNTDQSGNLMPRSFARQVEAQRGLPAGTVPLNGVNSTFVETRARGSTQPRYLPANLDNATYRTLTGANKWESMPIGTPSFADWYIRPRYENMTFTNVTIPRGNNGLFVNCTFIGVTVIDTDPSNTHELWQEYGRLQGTGATEPQPVPVEDKSLYDQLPLQNRPSNYSQLLDPPLAPDGTWLRGAARDTKLRSNNVRFHNCTFIGSVAAAKPQAFTQIRNKVQFTGSTRFMQKHPTDSSKNPREEDMDAIERSSLMLPHYSVDVGHFNAPTATHPDIALNREQNVQLSGTIIAGVLDVRGNTKIDGSIVATYNPEYGQGQMRQYGQPVGNPANYNVTLGYFGKTDDGDQESIDSINPASLPDLTGRPGQKRAGWDVDGDGLIDFGPTENPDPVTYPNRVEVPFYGAGRVEVRWNPNLPMPDGLMMPLSAEPVAGGYGEGGRDW